MPQLQDGIACLITTFLEYSQKDGDPKTLTRGELKELLKKEFGQTSNTASDKAALDKLFRSMDANDDGVVDFKEYAIAVASIAMCLNESISGKL